MIAAASAVTSGFTTSLFVRYSAGRELARIRMHTLQMKAAVNLSYEDAINSQLDNAIPARNSMV
jgi:hypothetical protein